MPNSIAVNWLKSVKAKFVAHFSRNLLDMLCGGVLVPGCARYLTDEQWEKFCKEFFEWKLAAVRNIQVVHIEPVCKTVEDATDSIGFIIPKYQEEVSNLNSLIVKGRERLEEMNLEDIDFGKIKDETKRLRKGIKTSNKRIEEYEKEKDSLMVVFFKNIAKKVAE